MSDESQSGTKTSSNRARSMRFGFEEMLRQGAHRLLLALERKCVARAGERVQARARNRARENLAVLRRNQAVRVPGEHQRGRADLRKARERIVPAHRDELRDG